ncbi:hypothetical protein AB0K00_52280 [Dactylosporangium sp. NPDC049525]|uniref:hypothetical protein n=1 Tax=Dactylosporangium sp. NPDC049525 TaxID=3154730 RepID=UPI003419E38E
MAETLGHLRDAVPEVQQIRGNQVPDLMRSEPGGPVVTASWLNRSVTFSGRSG